MRAEQLKLSIIALNKHCGRVDIESLRNPALRLYLTVSGQAKQRPEKQIGLFLKYCI